MKSILEYLQQSILIGDGAMGTLLYHYGVPVGSCGEELNLTRPEVVKDIHLSYLRAGAQVIETNTYGANFEKLSKYGLEEQVEEINAAAVHIARDAARDFQAYVVGAVGGIQGVKQTFSHDRLIAAYEQQIQCLVEAGVDALLLETFCQVEEAELAIQIARRLGDIPIICQLSIQDTDRTNDGVPLQQAFLRLQEAGANIVGLNCYNGPSNIIKSLEGIDLSSGLMLSAYPNAGLPEYVDGEYVYSSSPDYFGKSAHKLYELGVRIIGGCCGTTPAHISEIASRIQGMPPSMNHRVSPARVIRETEIIPQPEELFREKTIPELVKERTTIIVELDPPRDLEFEPFLEGAAALKDAGVDAVTLADNSLAMTRMSNMALGSLMKEKVGVRPLVHLACRDRNAIGQQSHLMGLYALGIDHVLAVTGDPTRYGDLPGASSVYDMTSFEMIRMIKQLNLGTGFSGRPMKKKASFTVAAAFNPNTRHLNKAVDRLFKKVDAGADYVMSQPLYDHHQIEQVAQATKDIPIPIFIGIMPLTSYRNAEFMHNEVPGIRLSDDVRNRMARFEGEDARKQGIEIAMELIETAQRYFQGIYLITPFMRYEMTVELANFVRRNVAVTNI